MPSILVSIPGATAFLFWREFLSLYTAEVVFADEPDITYEYKRNEKGDIIQVGMSDPEGADWKNYKA
ncbi:hypothetical protein ABU162_14355 [Paenibacillus thiaminolyticus]|uniref:hypothetical protein n=1 Tax=Paenibacillus thiaminolyticus TaxID=49283 RepID=UPI0035A71C83